jgi:hypothetical protein
LPNRKEISDYYINDIAKKLGVTRDEFLRGKKHPRSEPEQTVTPPPPDPPSDAPLPDE